MRSSLIWVCTVCSDLSVPIFKIITVFGLPSLSFVNYHVYMRAVESDCSMPDPVSFFKKTLERGKTIICEIVMNCHCQ